jgi:hypothetical protein
MLSALTALTACGAAVSTRSALPSAPTSDSQRDFANGLSKSGTSNKAAITVYAGGRRLFATPEESVLTLFGVALDGRGTEVNGTCHPERGAKHRSRRTATNDSRSAAPRNYTDA